MWQSRMFWRLFATYGVLLLAAIGLLGAVLSARMQQHYEQQVEDALRTRLRLVSEVVRDWPADRLAVLQARIGELGPAIKTRITIIDRDGKVLADSDEDPQKMENHSGRPEIEAARASGFGTATRHSDTLNKWMQYAAQRLNDNDSLAVYIRVALPVADIQQQLAWFGRAVWTVAAVTAMAAMLLALWLAQRITHPLQELTQSAARIATGEYGQKVYLSAKDEVGILARTFNHMSERLQSQFSQLEEDREQLRTILSSMVEGVVALDSEQRILFANERAGELLGLQTPSAVGRKLWEVVRQRALQDIVRKSLETHEACTSEVSWEGKGTSCLLIHAAPLPGRPTRGAVLVLHDTTELRRLERLRQDFVANVSHELKTPLAVIQACIETLLDGAADDAEHRASFLGQIGRQAEQLHALILDLLSLARIESGAELFQFEAVAVDPLIERCLVRHQARAEAKSQVLSAISGQGLAVSQASEAGGHGSEAPAPNPSSPAADAGSAVVAWADEDALNQILENLVDNALKYTPAGGRISVRWWSEDSRVHLEVTDTGIGIPEQDLPRIFERFYRVDKARSRELGGTGLGLSIVKHLVQAMQGNVHATSRLGQGTTFHVQLPGVPAS
jgi:two-component system, OmpR family, phosphate regulon sensor histidine kinase PhoR